MKRLLAVCCAVIFLDAAFFAALAPILPEFKREFALTTTEAGILSGSYAAGILLLALPGGWFAARFGPKPAVLVGLVGMGVFSAIFGFADSFGLLSASRFLQGAGGALMWAGAMSWVIRAGPAERRGALVGTLVAAATVGEMLGAPIGAVAGYVGRGPVFVGVSVLAALLLLAAFSLEGIRPGPQQALSSVARAVRRSHLLPAMLLVGAAAFAFGLVTVVAPLRLDELGAGAALIAAAFACGSIVETFVGPGIGRISDRIGRARPYQLGAAIGAVAILALSTLDTKPAVVAGLVVFAFAAALAFTPSIALAADSATNAGIDQGFASGLTNVAFGGGQMLGAVGGGALAAMGYLLPALVTVAFLAAAGIVAGRVAASEASSQLQR